MQESSIFIDVNMRVGLESLNDTTSFLRISVSLLVNPLSLDNWLKLCHPTPAVFFLLLASRVELRAAKKSANPTMTITTMRITTCDAVGVDI
jgi:hypothetical protein